ncbi:MAG: ATP-binding cassette domain-containing protein [Clostridiales bacterium]|jgi:peptide/nickel transport system ATP-binding protein|nr:ATP-binding cassette domain-containing protein [Clostridiales bacterium]
MESSLVEASGLKKHFRTKKGIVHAVDGVSFGIRPGKTMGIVGESGCGKSTLGRVLVHLESNTDGAMRFGGRDVTALGKRQLREFRQNAQMIFQDPYSSLNPRYTVEETIAEPLFLSRRYSRAELRQRTTELMGCVGMAQRLRASYPHELDGGRRQRVGIARALAYDPKFIVCDEPVSALDVSIQAQILNLLQDLKKEKNLTYMFITHDLSVVRYISDDIGVMYLGQLVETSPSKELFKAPCHPYTKALLSAIPHIGVRRRAERAVLKGEITSPIDPKPGCRFASRCPHALGECQRRSLALEEAAPGHFVSCIRAKELNGL